MRPHLGLLSIIGICLPSIDYLDCEFVDLVEVIGGMCDFVRLDVYKIEIFKDRLLKLGLEARKDESTSEAIEKNLAHPFLRRIRIVKPNDHLSIIHPGKVLIKDCRFCVAYVKVAAGLRREAGDDLALLGILEAHRERGRCLLIYASLGSFRLCQTRQRSLG
jgi:hypothetical protein